MPNYLNAISKAGIFYLYIGSSGRCISNLYLITISFAAQIGIHNKIAARAAVITNI